jgi:hypothetical protein
MVEESAIATNRFLESDGEFGLHKFACGAYKLRYESDAT